MSSLEWTLTRMAVAQHVKQYPHTMTDTHGLLWGNSIVKVSDAIVRISTSNTTCLSSKYVLDALVSLWVRRIDNSMLRIGEYEWMSKCVWVWVVPCSETCSTLVGRLCSQVWRCVSRSRSCACSHQGSHDLRTGMILGEWSQDEERWSPKTC